MAKLVALFLFLCFTWNAYAQQVIGQGRFINISATGNIQAAHFIGDGSQITGISSSAVVTSISWPIISRTTVPAGVVAVSDSTGVVTLTTLAAGLVSGTTTSGTFGYFKFVSGTLAGNGTAVSNVTASAMSWYGLASLPTQVAAVSNGTYTPSWYSVTNIPARVQAVSSGTPIDMTGLTVTGTISGSSVISTSNGGVVSGTYGYFKFVSGTIAGDGSGLAGVNAQAVSWTGIQGVPAGVSNISNSTGSITVTSVFAGLVSATSLSATTASVTTLAVKDATCVGTCTGFGSGGTSPGGNNNDIQFKDGVSFAGSDSLQWVSGTSTLSVSGTVSASAVNSPLVAKAWAAFNGIPSGVITISDSQNVSRITNLTGGIYSISLTNPMGSTSYAPGCGCGSGANTNSCSLDSIQTSSTFKIRCMNGTSAATNSNFMSLWVFGR